MFFDLWCFDFFDLWRLDVFLTSGLQTSKNILIDLLLKSYNKQVAEFIIAKLKHVGRRLL